MRYLLVAALVCLPVSASGHEIQGLWEGRITCGGAEHLLRLDLTKDGGTLDLPDLFVAGERVSDVKATPATLKFSYREARFSATLERGRMFGPVEVPAAPSATFEVYRRPRAIDPYRVIDEKLYLPNGKGPFPATLLPVSRESRFIAQRFAAAGIAALIGGDTALLRARPDITPSRISVLPPSFLRPPSSYLGCTWFGDPRSAARIEHAIAWALQQPKPQITSALYEQACLAARAGDSTKALALLDRAIEEDFDNTAQIEKDEDLADLRELGGFESIVHKSKMLEFPCGPSAPLACWQDAIPRLEQAHIEYPRSGRAAFNLALASQKTGDHATAATAFTEAAGLRYKPVVSAYDAALSFGQSGDRSQMLRWLDRALQLGFPVQRLLADTDFAALREDPEVKTLITRYGTNWPD